MVPTNPRQIFIFSPSPADGAERHCDDLVVGGSGWGGVGEERRVAAMCSANEGESRRGVRARPVGRPHGASHASERLTNRPINRQTDLITDLEKPYNHKFYEVSGRLWS